MKLFNNLPLYEALITNDECGVYKVSCVTDPATEVNWVAFDDDKPMQKFAVENKVERMVSGIIMVADKPIFRMTADGFEYYIVYSKDTLKVMAEKMIYDGVGSNVNIQHQDGTDVEGVNLVELYVINREKGIDPEYFKEVPDGSLVGTYKIHNEELWQMIENGEVLSFSLEGIFDVAPVEFSKQENNKTISRKYMSKLGKIKEALKSLLLEFGTVNTDKGVLAWDGDDELTEGMAVRLIDTDGNEIVPEDGTYKTEDKKEITVEGGKVAEIKDIEAEVAPEEPVENPVEEADPSSEALSEENPASEDTDTQEPETDENDAEIESLKARIDELEAENAQLKERIAELEKESAAPSADEEFKKMEKDTDDTKAGKMQKRGYRW